jgi:hypothetical protein
LFIVKFLEDYLRCVIPAKAIQQNRAKWAGNPVYLDNYKFQNPNDKSMSKYQMSNPLFEALDFGFDLKFVI